MHGVWHTAGKKSYIEAHDCCSLVIAVSVILCALRLWWISNVVGAMRTPSDVECNLPIVEFFLSGFSSCFHLCLLEVPQLHSFW